MLPFKKIVYPVDFSEPCTAIVPYVRDMQSHFSTELSLIHAYGAEALAYSMLPITDPQLPEQVRIYQEDQLRQFAAKHFPGVHVEIYAGVGEPGTIIHDVVKHQGADLVMMATHGRGPLRRMLLGSVTAKLLHDLTVPLWTGHPLRVPYRSVLCALDSSEESEAVLRAAASIAKSYKAQLSLVSVLEMPPISPEVVYGDFRADFIQLANTRLRELQGVTGIDAPHNVVDGVVSEAINDEAKRVGADLIITGRGVSQTAVSRIWSHLYPIIRHAPCPVLSI